MTAPGCPQAWPGGLPVGLLVECRFEPKHRGWHREADGTLSWGGKLTDEELVLAERLRRAMDPSCPVCGGGSPLDDNPCRCGSAWGREA